MPKLYLGEAHGSVGKALSLVRVRLDRYLFSLASYVLAATLLAFGTANAQDVFTDWYPEQLRFVIDVQFDGEVVETATYWIGDRALRAEFGPTVLILVDDDGPVVYFVDRETGEVDRMGESGLGLVATALPIGSAAHPCHADWPCSRVGDDTVNGRAVEVWHVQIPDLGETTAWVDKATRVQLRSRGTTEDGTVVTSEVVDFEVGPQPLELFEPPSED